MENAREERIEDAAKEIERQMSRKYMKNEMKWLHVNSKHDHLKPYLKQRLIEQL